MGFTTLLLTLLSLYSLTIYIQPTTAQPPFKCTVNTTCQALVGYKLPNTTSLSTITKLFGVKKFRSLLGANNLPITTPTNYTVTQNQTIKVPIPCKCLNNTGVSNKIPIYTVKKDDGLYHIAAEVFSRLLPYQIIAELNNITDVDKIEPGQELWIPLPCSCDDVEGQKVVHYGLVVEAGSSLEVIESELGTPKETVMRVNGIANDSQLIAGAVLDIPLKACSSSIISDSEDSPLLVSNNTYVLTAHQCVKCQCTAANNWTLQCESSQLKPTDWSTCPSMQCEGLRTLSIGNTTLNDCNTTTCAYAGYSANQTIFTTLATTASTCTTPNNNASRISLSWNFLFISAHLVLLFLHLLH